MRKRFGDLLIGETFMLNGKMYIKLQISYDFSGRYNAENILNAMDRQYIGEDESVIISYD